MVHLIDCYAYTSRWRHRHPAEKAIFAGGLLALSFFLPLAGLLVVLSVITLVALAGARIPARIFGRVMSLPLVFILIGAGSLLVSVSFGGGHFHIRYAPEGWLPAIQLSARALAAASCMIFFALTTPAADWLPLLRTAHVPAVIVDLMAMIYRLLFVFAERLSTLQQAQAARLGNRSLRSMTRTSGLIGANLFIQSLDRAQWIVRGMEARCYRGDIPFLPFERKPSFPVIVGAIVACLAVAGIGLLTRGWPHV